MVRRTALTSFLAISALLLLVGCAGTPHDFHAVVLTPSTAQFIGQGKTLAITAQVLSDSSGAGVVGGQKPATGSLSATTTTSTTYNAPAVVAVATPVTVTATSITFPAGSKSLRITCDPPPSIT